jgi:SsrA-binding protein
MTSKRTAKQDRRSDPSNRVLATNRQARRNFEVIEELECGISLIGSEVKSLREAKARLDDAYGRVIDGQLWLLGLHIAPYSQAHGFGSHEPDRRRRLLAHRGQIDRWRAIVEQQHLALVPLQLYLSDGRVKVLMALARGRRTYDKRQALARRDAELEARRAMVGALRGAVR